MSLIWPETEEKIPALVSVMRVYTSHCVVGKIQAAQNAGNPSG